jgi:hypothetical protein
VALDQRAHRAVEDQEAAVEKGAELEGPVGAHIQTKKPVRLRAKRVSLALAVFVLSGHGPEAPAS